jgi:[histone H3]-lysine36 N-dimethyltransferase SETMAR
MEKSVYRSYILVRHKLGINATTIFQELKSSYGDSSPSYVTVCRWIWRFDEGLEDLEDNPRAGRPITATTDANVKVIRELIDNNPHITYAQIEAETSLNPDCIHRIIHDHLRMRKLTSRWVPHELTAAQKAKRVASCIENLAKFNAGQWRICDIITGDESWIYCRKIGHKQSNASWVAYGDCPKTVVRRSHFEPKSMISVFFKSTGPVLIDCLERGKTIDNKYYIENCLKPAIKTVKELRVKSGTTNLKILHDNARPHVHKNVNNFLKSEGITIISHPPYSPDLAPCDFWLFDKIKQHLTDHADAQSLKTQITEILEAIPKEEYLKTFKKYLERMQLCINNQGEYFEHLI